MWKQQVVLEHDADPAPVRRHPYARRGVLQNVAVEHDAAAGERIEPGQGTQHGRLAGGVRAEKTDDVAARRHELGVDSKSAGAQRDVGLQTHVHLRCPALPGDGGHRLRNQWPRRATRTASETTSITRLSDIAAPLLFWSATYTASGMV